MKYKKKKLSKKATNKAIDKLLNEFAPMQNEITLAAFDAICYGEGFVYIKWDKNDNITVKRLTMRDLLK